MTESTPLPPSSKPDAVMSVLVVVNDDGAVLGAFLEELYAVLSAHFRFFEVLFIDNQSRDDSLEILQGYLERLANLRVIRLSTRSSIEVGIAAALEHCVGDYAVIMDPYQDRPADIPRLVAASDEGFDVVVGKRHGMLAGGVSRRAFFSLASRVLEQDLNPDSSYFRVMTRRVVTSLTKIKNRRRYFKYFNALVGFRQRTLDCPAHERARLKPKDPGFLSSLRRAADIVFSFSPAPLRWASGLGLLASLGNLAYLAYVFIVALVKPKLAEGWFTTSVVMATMFFCLFLILTILSEYVARILEETQERPLYFIEMEVESSNRTKSGEQVLNIV